MCPQLSGAFPVCHWAGVLPTQVLSFVMEGLLGMNGNSEGVASVGSLANEVLP